MPERNDDPINITQPKNTYLYYVFPETLDFSSTDSIEITISGRRTDRLTDIRLNPDGEDLDCKFINSLKVCTVPKSHFKNGGYYYIHHKNNLNKYSTNYEIFGVKVILPPDTGDKNTGRINNNSLIQICLLGFLLL